MKTQFIKNEIY